jgi:hypothetical protein
VKGWEIKKAAPALNGTAAVNSSNHPEEFFQPQICTEEVGRHRYGLWRIEPGLMVIFKSGTVHFCVSLVTFLDLCLLVYF